MLLSPIKISPFSRKSSVLTLSEIYTNYSYYNAWSPENKTVVSTTTTELDYAGVHDLSNPTSASQPLFSATSMNGRAGHQYIANDYLIKTFSNYRSADTTGVIDGVFKTGSDVTTASVQFASGSASAGIWIGFYTNSGKLRVIISNHASTASLRYVIDCDTILMVANTSYAVSIEQTGSGVNVYINGVLQTITVVAGTASTYWFSNITTRINIAIGTFSTAFSNDTKGFIGVRPYVSSAKTLEANNYLKLYYGLTAYKLTIDGDSIDWGQSASFEANLRTKIVGNAYTIKNVSIQGQQLGGDTPNMLSRSNPTSEYNSNYTRNILLMGGGTNDICHMLIDGWGVDHIFADWLSYYNQRISEGFIVIPRTVLPRSQPACNNIANFENDRQAYNTLIKNYCNSNGIVFCNCGDDATIGVFGASDNLTYYNADKVHLATAGANILGNLYGDAVNTVLAAL